MMTMTALSLGSLTMAAHQVALQIFWTLTYFVDPLFVAATSFIARDHGRRPARVRRMAWLLMGMSLCVGSVITMGCIAIPTFGVGIFTADVELQALIRGISPLMGASQFMAAGPHISPPLFRTLQDSTFQLNLSRFVELCPENTQKKYVPQTNTYYFRREKGGISNCLG